MSLLNSIAMILTTYMVQFFIVPLFLQIGSSDSLRINLTIGISSILVTLIFMMFREIKARYIFLCVILYYGLAYLFNPNAAYGIGRGFLNLPELDVLVLTLIVLCSQITTWVIVKIFNLGKLTVEPK
ncbi:MULTISPECIES: hypothetical protein [unclassified Fusibacter]|uniref:hypothetical protein n=1 Tax=unclassified Fusibacter TaxID=2624464 RepID=UPI00101016E2|nr:MULTISPECIES: hypothetical protein [unclassified Fusibacter]MCK8060230.1 hypothetical protein [Fusibacter sp. A2]NPE22369.1 hypothetical protein [Fusibacter sp. A1]